MNFDIDNKDRLLFLLCCSCKAVWKDAFAAMLGVEGSLRQQAEMIQRSMILLHASDEMLMKERIRMFVSRMKRSGFRHRSKRTTSIFQHRAEDNSLVAPSISKATKNNIWLSVFHWSGRDHWVGIPREVAKRAIILGHLPVEP